MSIVLTYITMEKIDDACKNLKKALDIKPDYYMALNSLGVCYLNLYDNTNKNDYFYEACNYLNKSLKINNNNISTLFYLGVINTYKKETENEAIKFFEKTLDVINNHKTINNSIYFEYIDKEYVKITSYLYLGELYRSSDTYKALLCSKKAYILSNNDDYCLKELIFSYKERMKSTYIAETLIQNVESIYFFGSLVPEAYSVNKDIELDLEFLDQLIENHPDNYEILEIKGRLYQKKGDISATKDFFRKSLELNPDNEELYSDIKKLEQTNPSFFQWVLGYFSPSKNKIENKNQDLDNEKK